MRLVQVLVPNGKRGSVLEVLDSNEIDYGVTDETGDDEYGAIVTFPLPTAAVEPILEALDEVGIDEGACTFVLDVETVISNRFERLEEEYATESERRENGGITGEDRIAREELTARAKDLASGTPTFAVLTFVSAVVATAGLLLDSPATVVGSMVIAPLIGPSMAASIGTVMDDRALFQRGVRMQLLGIGVAIVGATAFAFLARHLYLVPPGLDVLAIAEVSERATPTILVLAIAIGAGIAGILSLMTGVSTALVGVMIAVALIPPAAAVGIGVAFGSPAVAIGAGILLTVNTLSINLSSLLTLWFEGYRPNSWFHVRDARSALVKQTVFLTVAIALVSVFLVGVTYDSYVASTTEEQIQDAIELELELVDEQLQLRDLTIERTGVVPPLETDRVIVSVAVDPDASIPQLVVRLTDRIDGVTGTSVDVEVEFVFVQKADHPTSR